MQFRQYNEIQKLLHFYTHLKKNFFFDSMNTQLATPLTLHMPTLSLGNAVLHDLHLHIR